jgi:hypothetical protein
MPYCPNCRDEYSRKVLECPYCGARLVDRLDNGENRSRKKGNSEVGDLVCLREFPSSMYAYMLQGALENEGIASVIKDDKDETISTSFDDSSRPPPSGNVTIWVPKKDHKTCREIADQMFEDI